MNSSSRQSLMIWVSILIPCLFGGCATILQGTSTNVGFYSDPSEAKIYVNGFLMGTTPRMIKLESNREYQIEFRMEGFEPKVFTLHHHVGVDWVIFDVIFGVFPVIFDAATGAWYSLDQENVSVILDPSRR